MKRIPPRADPITTPRETDPSLVGVVTINEKLEFTLAAIQQISRIIFNITTNLYYISITFS